MTEGDNNPASEAVRNFGKWLYQNQSPGMSSEPRVLAEQYLAAIRARGDNDSR